MWYMSIAHSKVAEQKTIITTSLVIRVSCDDRTRIAKYEQNGNNNILNFPNIMLESQHVIILNETRQNISVNVYLS